METKAIMDQFDYIENIQPSDNWNVQLQNKLYAAKLSKSNSADKINALVLALLLINIGIIWSSIKTVNPGKEVAKNSEFKVISEQLLIPNN